MHNKIADILLLIMRLLTNTNIMVDDFDYCKGYPKGVFVHFLTHFHQDHWEGMSPLWDYGPIYCSEITKKLILNKFPKIQNLTALEMDTKHTIVINKDTGLTVDVYLFDAFHIPGSVMYLFQGFMGTILHTGDFRFHPDMIALNPLLFPKELRAVEGKPDRTERISIHVDEMIFDNTYCDPMHDFPREEVALNMMIDIIEKNRGKHVIIAMGATGKERIMMSLAQHFQTLVVLAEDKLQRLKAMEFRDELFTSDKNQGWIEIIRKRDRTVRLEEETAKENKNFILISIDFLMFKKGYRDPDGINYMVPYSLHSNYMEMVALIKAVNPGVLKCLVQPWMKLPEYRKKFRDMKIDNIRDYLGYLKSLKSARRTNINELRKRYTNVLALSDEYKGWMTLERQLELLKMVGITTVCNPSLRRQRKTLPTLRELELELYGKVITGKKTRLSDLAGELRSKHNNKTVDGFVQILKEPEIDISMDGFDMKEEKVSKMEEIKLVTKKSKRGKNKPKLIDQLNDEIKAALNGKTDQPEEYEISEKGHKTPKKVFVKSHSIGFDNEYASDRSNSKTLRESSMKPVWEDDEMLELMGKFISGV